MFSLEGDLKGWRMIAFQIYENCCHKEQGEIVPLSQRAGPESYITAKANLDQM